MRAGAWDRSKPIGVGSSFRIRIRPTMVTPHRSTRSPSQRASFGRKRKGAGTASMSTSGRAILSRPDVLLPRERRGDGPIFAEAWHADALAIAIVLTRRGVFSAAEWSAALAAAIRASQARGEPDDEEHYY